MKIGRNQPCHCGSGKKYKKCHGSMTQSSPLRPDLPQNFDKIIQQKLTEHKAAQMIREQQQGLGRPILAAKIGGHQVVAVRNKVYFSPTWKTVPDFLSEYMKNSLDPSWGNVEIAKPLADRHTILQWYDEYCLYQKKTIKAPGVISSAPIVGVVACYIGLAYSLYLLDHNVELQERLVRRLKRQDQFQGAYYELMIANVLIRAGFELTLEDETDGATKHCEFAAISKKTGKKYWVEAKARAVAGILGKTAVDGGNDKNPLAQMIPHLNAALAKPATDERLIFIDLNATMPANISDDNRPDFINRATRRLEAYETKELTAGTTAYVFITNAPFHRDLQASPALAVVPFGLGLPDFNKPGMFRLSDRYRQEQKHRDALNIADAFSSYTEFPSTFDGSLPSEAYTRTPSRIIIGQTYLFEGIDGNDGTQGLVTSATVNVPEKMAYIAITTPGKKSMILTQPLSDDQVEDFKLYGDAYFGLPRPPSKKLRTAYDLFQWLVRSTQGISRQKMLNWFGKRPDLDRLAAMNDDDLHLEYCEAHAMAVQAMSDKRGGSET